MCPDRSVKINFLEIEVLIQGVCAFEILITLAELPLIEVCAPLNNSMKVPVS